MCEQAHHYPRLHYLSIRLDKFLTLKNTNTFAFSSLNRNFALPLNKVGCSQEYKEKLRIPLIFHSFALPLQKKSHLYGNHQLIRH